MNTLRAVEWLSGPGFELSRQSTPDWLWTDYVAWAQHRFGTDCLTPLQFEELCADFVHGRARRMGLDQGKRPEPIEMRPNRKNYTPGPTRFYLAGHRVAIGFPAPHVALDWGMRQVRKSGLGWFKTLAEVREKLDLYTYATQWRGKPGAFGLGGQEVVEDAALRRVIAQRLQAWNSELLPYPDHTPMDRQYLSMDRGVRFRDPTGRAWRVDRVAHRLDDYPQLTLIPEEA